MHPAGWYPDPKDPLANRYWDGTAWTEQTAPRPPDTPARRGRQAKLPVLLVGLLLLVVALGFSLLVPTVNLPDEEFFGPSHRIMKGGDRRCGSALNRAVLHRGEELRINNRETSRLLRSMESNAPSPLAAEITLADQQNIRRFAVACDGAADDRVFAAAIIASVGILVTLFGFLLNRRPSLPYRNADDGV